MSGLTTDYLSKLGLSGYDTVSSSGSSAAPASKGDKELGQADFLNLMIAQLANQDPSNPVQNEDFVAQMAQFSTLTGIQELSGSFKSLSQSLLQGQTLEAASLVGQDVLVPASSVELSSGQGASGAVDLSTSTSRVEVEIYGANGALVRTLDLGSASAGLQDFEWDGLQADGSVAPAGRYEFRITAEGDGSATALTTLLDGRVKSVSMDSGTEDLRLDIQGMGSMNFASVKRVG